MWINTHLITMKTVGKWPQNRSPVLVRDDLLKMKLWFQFITIWMSWITVKASQNCSKLLLSSGMVFIKTALNSVLKLAQHYLNPSLVFSYCKWVCVIVRFQTQVHLNHLRFFLVHLFLVIHAFLSINYQFSHTIEPRTNVTYYTEILLYCNYAIYLIPIYISSLS